MVRKDAEKEIELEEGTRMLEEEDKFKNLKDLVAERTGGKADDDDSDDDKSDGSSDKKVGPDSFDLVESTKDIMFTSSLNWLLVLVPVAMVGKAMGFSDGWMFLLSLLPICPLAERLGYVTEQMASYTNPTLGGLLNATFGNMTEIIVSFFALKSGLLRVVQLSLLGSILSNLLLVLGCAFFIGGTKYKTQTFNKTGVAMNSALLLLAVISLSVPSVLHTTHTEMHGTSSELALSRFTSLLLLGVYGTFLYFQLVTHRDLYEEEDDDDEEEEEVGQTFGGCLIWLTIITIFISVLSDYLVDAIEGAAESIGMPVAFISVIVLPIVGNAAEHASAVIFAMKNKMDIAIGVAIGSATQISLLVIPLMILMGWAVGQPLDLNLHVFETTTFIMTVITVAFVVQDGQSNWLKGMTLTLAYCILAASFFFHKDNKLTDQNATTWVDSASLNSAVAITNLNDTSSA
uniref:Vacuolar cation/proton exchanger n=1 Tax=Pyramimonas obovata TaxID=1411642 RepID=A0A7S0RX33_9CHLO|mmetsp:Transcript_8737/g.18116  ORF Transcript_8737/g.18116 Transcript_8737/m.18116 type:complete len:460 (+) Transcript_8737:202-1581(+)|eukprot:CAMPEP_0118935898 /NCGR_PEP_ID=MMETSP1169-20130426/15890_1 /TAXON_ID=36882 /ORGANISM="Pyramimonas obovata, Strain CCMP722" /LENGTH=459 /DNA_ID=CAMNT_0006878977 /DNA_START=202 /DNA_END=1581 /DNA_ORIENTATION=+